jgi:hypothetical protein
VLLSLVPTIRGDQKPALTTSLMTVVLMAIFSFTMATMGMWLAVLSNLGILGAWSILAVQRYQAMRRERHAGLIAQIESEALDVIGEDEAPSAPAVTKPVEAQST